MRALSALALVAMLALGACAQNTQQSPLTIAQNDSEQLAKLTDRAVAYARRPTCGPTVPATVPCATAPVRRELANAASTASIDNQAALTAAKAVPIDTVAIGSTRLKAGQTRDALANILSRESVP